ncbi:hypothetical protein QJQ45_025280, partial [Haematococcus lacustris]
AKSSRWEALGASAWTSGDCRQLEHDKCSMAWWLQARQQWRRAAANKEVARSQQGMIRSKTVSGRPLDMSGPQCPDHKDASCWLQA